MRSTLQALGCAAGPASPPLPAPPCPQQAMLQDTGALHSTTSCLPPGLHTPQGLKGELQPVRDDVITLNYYSQTGFFKQEFREDLAPTPWLCLLPSCGVPEAPGPVFIFLHLHSILGTSKAGTESRENKYTGRTQLRESCMGAI